jgi:hypothetical protein
MARKRLGELLLEHGIISRDQLEKGLNYQRQTGHRLGTALVALGFLTEEQLCAALGKALGIKAVRMPPRPDQVDWAAVQVLRARFCEANDLFPISLDASNPTRKSVIIAMADPLNIPAIEEIEFTTGMKVVPVIAPLSGVRAAIRRYYLKQNPDVAVPGTGASDRMTIIRAGGVEDVVSTSSRPQRLVARPPEEDLPLVEAEPVREVTERTALADLIQDRVERNRRKRSSVEADLDYLFGVPDTTGDSLQKLESRFWALLRIMAKKGLITRDEFLRELADVD